VEDLKVVDQGNGNETRVSSFKVLDTRPKLLGFHIAGPATGPYAPDKETWQRAKKDYTAQDMLREEAK
jgi:hypothetical protein